MARMTTTGVHVHRAERADVLADALAEVLARPLADPFVAEIVAVPAKGVERWLAQRLSHHLGAPGGDGVCAGVAFSSPAAIVGDVVAATGGPLSVAHEDPWRPERAVWPLLEVLDAAVDEPWCAPLRAHRSRRHALARRVAELFSAYATHRPEMLRGWAAGDDAVDPDLAWQPELWRRLRSRINAPDPTERVEAACAALRARPEAVALPERLSLFGPTRLAAQELSVLAALGVHREVHLWLPHPSPALWAQVRPCGVPPRDADPSAAAAEHPLLSSLGRDVREMQVRLAAALPDAHDQHHPRPDPPATLLGRLQRDVRDDRSPDGSFVPEPGDRSVQVHACHGPDRQVEVLREVVLGLLEADPTLEARDVLVMCPDIETFAPLISASFGPGAHPAQALPVRLADRALRQVNPLLDVVARLLELADARLTASQVLDLLAADPVRTRFGLDEGDLERLRELAVGSGVRWGLDAAHRRPFKLESFGQNTWAAGLDRLLLGVAMAGDEHTWLGTALPRGGRAGRHRAARSARRVRRAAGRRARAAGRRAAARSVVRGPHDRARPAHRHVRHRRVAGGPGPGRAGRGGAHRGPARGLRPARARRHPQPAGRSAARASEPRGLPHRHPDRRHARARCARCRTGSCACSASTTGCSPVRARSTGTTCWPGVRSSGSGTCAAKTASSCSMRSCRPRRRWWSSTPGPMSAPGCAARPPSRSVSCSMPSRPPQPSADGGRPAPVAALRRAQLRRPHPRSASTAPSWRGPAPRPRPVRRRRRSWPHRSPRLRRRALALDELVAFVEQPVKGFLTQRVGLSLFAGDEAPADALPVAPDGLATWAIGNRMLADRLAGADLERCRQAEWRRGELPPGALGDLLLARVLDDVEPLVAAAAEYRVGTAADRDVDLELPGGARVVGTVGDLYGTTMLRVEYSRLTPKQRIRSWVRLVALTAATGEPWRAVTIGRGERFGIMRATVGPVQPAHAREVVAELVALRAEGLCAPLPLSALTGNSYARVRRGGAAARRCGRGGHQGVDERRGRRALRCGPRTGMGPQRARERAHRGGRAAGRRADPVRHPGVAAVGARCCRRRMWSDDDSRARPRGVPGVRARCPPAPPCWRPARAPGRRSRSPRSPPATSPRACATLPELMLVTFGREATTELRERVRARLLSADAALADPAAAVASGDPVHALLADAARQRGRAAQGPAHRALATFDAATIATTHQFCQQMLAGLGVAGDADPDAVFVESIDDMVTEVVDDFYVRKYGDRAAGPPQFDPGGGAGAGPRGRLRRAGPAGTGATRSPARSRAPRFRFASAVRAEVARRKRERRIYTYDDMLTRLDAALAARRASAAAAAAGALPGRAGRRVPGHRPGAVVASCAAPSTATPRWC